MTRPIDPRELAEIFDDPAAAGLPEPEPIEVRVPDWRAVIGGVGLMLVVILAWSVT